MTNKVNPLSPLALDGPEGVAVSRAPFVRNRYREALLAACDRLEKAKQFKAQHGAVRIIMQDGKPGPDADLHLKS